MNTSHPTSASVRRPSLVTVLVVLVVLGGIVSITAGIIGMIASSAVISGGLVLVLVGLVYLAVAKGLADGRGIARTVVAVISVIQVVSAIITVSTTDDGGTRSSAIGTAIVGVIILAILFSPASTAFFNSRR